MIRDLQNSLKNKKPFENEFLKLLESIGRMASTVRAFKKKKMSKSTFNSMSSYLATKLVINSIRVANSLNVDLDKQLFEWWKLRKVKKFNVVKGYNKLARIYDKMANLVIEIEEPKVLRLLGDVKDKKILDAGCGTGRYSIILARKGAQVYGIDISRKMLGIAKEKAEKKKLKINFRIGDITNMPYKDNQFDIVLSTLALDHVKNLKKAIHELIRVCKPKGKIIFSIMHPEIAKGNYVQFKTEEGMIYVKRFEKKISDLVTTLNKSGARIDKIIEVKLPRKAEKIDPVTYMKLKEHNIILIVKATKLKL